MWFGQLALFDVLPDRARVRRADDAHNLFRVEVLVILERRELSRGVLAEAHRYSLRRLPARFYAV